MRFLAVALIALFLATGCGSDGSSVAPTGPAPFLPLTWTDVPDSLTVARGETVTFTATLSAAVDASVAISASDSTAEVSGELIHAGVFRGTVTGVGHGDVVVAIVATHPDYDRADAAINVSVEGIFSLQIWRQMVFGEWVCPDRECHRSGLSVEERTIQVPEIPPKFHLVDGSSESSAAAGLDGFSESEWDVVEVAIRDAVEQLTAKPLGNEITSSSEPRMQRGWIDVLPVNDAWFEGRFPEDVQGGSICLASGPNGEIVLNSDCSRFGLDLLRISTMRGVADAFGFLPFSAPGDHLMDFGEPADLNDFSDEEQFHARLAHVLGHGAPYTPDPLTPAGPGAQ